MVYKAFVLLSRNNWYCLDFNVVELSHLKAMNHGNIGNNATGGKIRNLERRIKYQIHAAEHKLRIAGKEITLAIYTDQVTNMLMNIHKLLSSFKALYHFYVVK